MNINEVFLREASSNNLQGMQKCINSGAWVNYRDNNGNSALRLAANYGQVAAVEKLVGIPGINRDIQDNGGNAPALIALNAVRHVSANQAPKFFAIVKRLLDTGASATAENINGLSPIKHDKYSAFLNWLGESYAKNYPKSHEEQKKLEEERKKKEKEQEVIRMQEYYERVERRQGSTFYEQDRQGYNR